jgi:hypothetical protein
MNAVPCQANSRRRCVNVVMTIVTSLCSALTTSVRARPFPLPPGVGGVYRLCIVYCVLCIVCIVCCVYNVLCGIVRYCAVLCVVLL